MFVVMFIVMFVVMFVLSAERLVPVSRSGHKRIEKLTLGEYAIPAYIQDCLIPQFRVFENLLAL